MVIWIFAAIAIGSMGLSVHTLRRHKSVVAELERARNEKESLVETMVSVLDEEGNVRGHLALPGEVTTGGVSRRLAIAEKSVSSIQEEMKKHGRQMRKAAREAAAELMEARGALEAARSRERHLEQTLAKVVDEDGKVLAQIRLPGKQMKNPPITTPCGDMCKKAFFSQAKPGSRNGTWHCIAGMGRPCDQSRPKFVDAYGQCVLFERDDDC